MKIKKSTAGKKGMKKMSMHGAKKKSMKMSTGKKKLPPALQKAMEEKKKKDAGKQKMSYGKKKGMKMSYGKKSKKG